MKSKLPLTPQEMQRRATISRWRNLSKADRSAIMRAVVNARWHATSKKKKS